MRAGLVVPLVLALATATLLPELAGLPDLTGLPGVAAAQTVAQNSGEDAGAAERAALQIEDAQARAQAAAAALATAETQVAEVDAERQQLEATQRTTQGGWPPSVPTSAAWPSSATSAAM
jgi:hypothetical protein